MQQLFLKKKKKRKNRNKKKKKKNNILNLLSKTKINLEVNKQILLSNTFQESK